VFSGALENPYLLSSHDTVALASRIAKCLHSPSSTSFPLPQALAAADLRNAVDVRSHVNNTNRPPGAGGGAPRTTAQTSEQNLALIQAQVREIYCYLQFAIYFVLKSSNYLAMLYVHCYHNS